MASGFLDWLGRVVMLVLAGMVTLSIIGSIAAIPSGSLETRMGLEMPPPVASPPPESDPQSAETRLETTARPDGEGQGASASGASPPADPAPAAQWLEAITYALLALVGLAALASLILWRGLRERRRIAEALEALAARP